MTPSRYALFCLLLALPTVAAQDNCGEKSTDSANEVNGCNLKLQEEHDCNFQVTNTLATPTANDDRTVGLEYKACTIRSEHEDECTEPELVVVYGNAVVEVDDMLVQRQGDQICFVYDHHDGNAPTEDCRADCLDIFSDTGKELTLDTDSVSGLPNYGSVTRNRHVTLLETGTRSGGGMSLSAFASLFLVGALVVKAVLLI